MTWTYTHWQMAQGPLGEETAGQSCVRYIRLAEAAVIAGFEWQVYKRGWSGGGMLKHYPKQIRIYLWHPEAEAWRLAYAHDALPRQDRVRIELPEPIAAAYVRAEVTELYTASPNHTEIATNPRIVPYHALDHLICVRPGGAAIPAASASADPDPLAGESGGNRGINQEEIASDEGAQEKTYANSFMEMAFSPLFPSMTRWGWDGHGLGRQGVNLLAATHDSVGHPVVGPWLRTVNREVPAHRLTAEVQMEERVIRYLNVRPVEGLRWDYTFTVMDDELELQIVQTADLAIKAIECQAWRWVWNLEASIFSPLAMPLTEGHTGRCAFPTVGHAPNYGNIAMELKEGGNAYIRTDTWRERSLSMLGIELGVELDEFGELIVQPGVARATIRISRAHVGLQPSNDPASGQLHEAFRRSWGSGFGFRPEYFGMSNNAASLNCHFVQYMYMDLAYHTCTSVPGVNITELMGYTISLALAGGLGYGDNRDYFMDSDPSLLIGAGAYLHKTKNRAWAERNWQAMASAAERMLEKTNEEGLVVCKKLAGISGVRDWSSNWWDVVSFGHLDAYANALAYRALNQIQSIARWLGREEDAGRFEAAAHKLKAYYFRTFYCSDSGWLAGWKSRDGQLHDYAFLFVNGIAVVNGLIPDDKVREVMERLERKREEVGYTMFSYGFPGNLLPIRQGDYAPNAHGSPQLEDGSDSFQDYQNGGASMSQAYHYVRALGRAGMPNAGSVSMAILDAFERCGIIGGLNAGGDWKTWDGAARGYEGLLTDQCYVLLAAAQNLGLAEDIPLIW